MGTKLSALMVEDSEDDALLVALELERAGYDLTYERVESAESMLNALGRRDWDIMFADYSMPHFDSPTALRLLKESGKDIPFIIVSGTIGEDAAVKAMHAGAHDYVLKGNLKRLTPAVERELREAANRREHLLAESTKREAENRYRALFEYANDIIYTHDMEGRITSLNAAGERITGYTRAEALGMNIFQVVALEFRDYAREQMAEKLEGLGSTVYEIDLIAKNGERISVEVSTQLIQGPRDQSEIQGIARDLTGRRTADEALRTAEAKYRSIVQNAALGIYTTTSEGRFVDANPALVRMLGYDSASELLELDLANDLYFDRRERARVLSQYAGLEAVGPIETLWKRKDGKLISVLIQGRSIRDEHGTLVGFEGIAEDFTQRNELEQQLRQSQKMEAVGRLAGGIAHDFNNLLTVISGYSELVMRDSNLDESARLRIEEVRTAARRAADLTRQLLTFSRKQVVQPKLLSSNDVIAGTERMLRRLIGEDIDLRTEFDPELWLIKADSGQIEQIIMNLVINSRDAMPNGGKLTIATVNKQLDSDYVLDHAEVTMGRYVALIVRDTGIGMDTETQSHIFEPFFTTKDPDKGTGLGLSTVYGIVKQSGGHIWVRSSPGAGTEIEIQMPAQAGEIEPAHAVAHSSQSHIGTETILLVEDDSNVRKIVTETLGIYGYVVLAASNGEEAIRICQETDFAVDLVLSDVVMPGMNGRELVSRVKELRPEARVLFMSGYTKRANGGDEILEANAPLLNKPFTPEQLAARVREALDLD